MIQVIINYKLIFINSNNFKTKTFYKFIKIYIKTLKFSQLFSNIPYLITKALIFNNLHSFVFNFQQVFFGV